MHLTFVTDNGQVRSRYFTYSYYYFVFIYYIQTYTLEVSADMEMENLHALLEVEVCHHIDFVTLIFIYP